MLERQFKASNDSKAITYITLLFLLLSFTVSWWPLYTGVSKDVPSQVVPWLRTVASRSAHDLVLKI